MRDLEIVALLAVGDPAGLEAAYTEYADRIHDYARYMLRFSSPDTAADVTQDTFLIAVAKVGSLRDPNRFRPWLYAIARNECLRVIRTTKRAVPIDPEDTEHLTAEGSPDMSTGLAGDDLRVLVHAAAEGLSPKDREVFELGLRHDLSGRDVARALGVTDNAAHAMLSRVRSQFEKALGALMVARQGRGSCSTLDEMLSEWDGRFQPLWRKRVARHIADCDICATVEKREMSPAALLAVTPFLAAPTVVRSRVLEDRTELVAYSKMLVERAGPFDADGFPGLPAPERRRRGLLAVVVALLLLFGGVAVVQSLVGGPDGELLESAVGVPSTTAPSTPSTTKNVGRQETLHPKPSVVVEPMEDPTDTPTPTVTTSAPTPTVSTPPPSSAPPTKKPADPTSQVAIGTLQVSPLFFTLNPGDSTGVRLTARDGQVGWSVDPDSLVDWNGPLGGSLNAGQSKTVSVSLPASATNPVNVTLKVSGHRVTISAEVVTPG